MKDSQMFDPGSVSMMPNAIRHGVLYALIGISLTLLYYVLGWSDPTNESITANIATVINLAVPFAILVFAIKQHRDEELDGFISFGRAFGLGMLIFLISGVITSIFMYIHYSFIDTEFFTLMIEGSRAEMERAGNSDDEIKQGLNFIRMIFNPTGMSVLILIFSAIFGAIASLIVSAIMKKEPHYS